MHMVKLSDGKERSQEAKKILTALSCMGDIIAGQRHLKLKEIGNRT